MEQPGAFFFWMGACALVSWRTAFQMPDGFGNAIFGMQILAAAISGALMAAYLPSLINPRFEIITSVNQATGHLRTKTIPRRTAARAVAIAVAVFLAGNIGGYALDRAMGLPDRYADDAVPALTTWVTHEPALARCLGTVWAPATPCTLVIAVSADDAVAERTSASGSAPLRASIEHARCGGASSASTNVADAAGSPAGALARCATESLRDGTIELPARRHASFAYAGETRLTVVTVLVGTGPPPPVERGP